MNLNFCEYDILSIYYYLVFFVVVVHISNSSAYVFGFSMIFIFGKFLVTNKKYEKEEAMRMMQFFLVIMTFNECLTINHWTETMQCER